MNDAVVVQHIVSGSAYRACLGVTVGRHLEYTARHAMDYCLIEADVNGWDAARGHWGEVALIERFTRDYRYVFYVDADAAIYDLDVDLREAFAHEDERAGILAVQHPGPPVHLNTGVLYVRHAAGLSEFLDLWLDGYPGCAPWWEQGVFNAMARGEPLVGRIGLRWNSTWNIAEAAEPIVIAWHGNHSIENRIRLMESFPWK